MVRRSSFVALVALLMTATSSPAALATFPGDNGRIAWSRDGDIFTMRTDGTGKLRLTRNARWERASWSPNGRWLAVVQAAAGPKQRDRILLMRPRGGDKRVIARADHSIEIVAWSPDGSRLAFCDLDWSGPFGQPRTRPSSIKVVDVGTGVEHQLTDFADGACQLSWSPDSRRLAFVAATDEISDVFVVNADGSDLRQVTESVRGRHFDVAWRPTGNRLAYVRTMPDSEGARAYKLETVRTDGTDVRVLTAGPFVRFPQWSPNGRWLLYFRFDLLRFHVIRANGAVDRRMPRVEPFGLAAAWSPTSTRIAFVNNEDIYTVRRDGTGKRRLVGAPARSDSLPDWQAR